MDNSTPFEVYLRTGRRIVASQSLTEFKFNPWHDPKDGRFTYARQGNFFGRGSGANGSSRERFRGNGGGFGGGGAGGTWGGNSPSRGRSHGSSTDARKFDPRNPRNHSTYKVKRGDTLTSIARQRKGLTAADLAWLNGVGVSDTLRVGQQIKIPTQAYLDAGRQARNKMLALSHYLATHNGKLPPNAANPPPIDQRTVVIKNGYRFEIDAEQRVSRVSGELTLTNGRKRLGRVQLNAGKPDRRTTDHGGHFVAPRFNGPTDWFNHFAQDAKFNQKAYLAIENSWARDLRSGRRVTIDIAPQYVGSSKRPTSVLLVWYVDGTQHKRRFPNEQPE